ncbi:PadR family transcriptional regulator [Brevibacterium oceani]|uniref:PadR family transcriptional regulator n=1 Tax=Brevibacterium oceani TaxID=358099 RepID=UPI0015E64D64|nr:PadR family transcriptional regulator [Brevibacterium oceani]
MSLRSALLALLRIGPMSGYELQKQFSQSVGHVWHAPDSQIYPELKKMANDGLITAEEQARGSAGMRKLYHVTKAGQKAFTDWMDKPLKYQRTRDAAHLKAAYLESASDGAVREFLESHIEHWQNELECWEDEIAAIEAETSPMLVRRLAAIPESERTTSVAYKRFAYEGLADRARSEITWARRGLDLVRELER